MPFLIPDTIKDTLSSYLRAEEQPVQYNPFHADFGNFEYLPTNPQGVLFTPDSTTYDALLMVSGNEGVALSFSPIVSGVLFLMFLICLVVFSFIFSSEGVAFSGNFNTVFALNKRPYKVNRGQSSTIEIRGGFFLIFQSILLYTIFIAVYLQDNELLGYSLNVNALRFLGIFGVLTLLAGLKYLMYRIIAGFFLQNDINSWISRYFRLIEFSGVVIFIPLFTYVFLPESRAVLVILIWIIIISVRMMVVIGLLNIFVKNKVGGFYFFVYLCGTEIAPYIILFKGLLSLISIAGNNII